MRLALFQPDIPQNTGTLLRLGACLDVPLDIIEPCGFILTRRRCAAPEWIIWKWCPAADMIPGQNFCGIVKDILRNMGESFC